MLLELCQICKRFDSSLLLKAMPKPELQRLLDSRSRRFVVNQSNPGAKRQRTDSDVCKALQDSIASALVGNPESQQWHSVLAAELASRPRHQARVCLSWLRNGHWQEIENLFHAGNDHPSESAKVAVDRIVESEPKPTEPVRPQEMAKTLTSRFSNVSDEITCPTGCKGPTRYGHRVGDVSKYVTMEREAQLMSVLAYCPTCHLTFDAHL
eukprot:s226_g12.t1